MINQNMDDKYIEERFAKWMENIDLKKIKRQNQILEDYFDYILNFPENAFIDQITDEMISEHFGQFSPLLSKNLSLYLKCDDDGISIVGKFFFKKEFGGRVGYAHGAGVGFILYVSSLILVNTLKFKNYIIRKQKILFFRKTEIFSSKIIISTLKYNDKNRFVILNNMIDHEEKISCSLEIEYTYFGAKF